MQDLYNQPISRLVEFIVAAYHHNPTINFEIFVHKAEKLQEDEKIENFRQINERVTDRLMDIAPEFEQQIILNFHLTSIFDHSLHQAFSRVLQKLTDSLPYLEDLLNSYCAVNTVRLLSDFITDRSGRTRKHRKSSFSMHNPGFMLQLTYLPLTRLHIIFVVTTYLC